MLNVHSFKMAPNEQLSDYPAISLERLLLAKDDNIGPPPTYLIRIEQVCRVLSPKLNIHISPQGCRGEGGKIAKARGGR